MTGDDLKIVELIGELEYNGNLLPDGFKYPFPKAEAEALIRDGRAKEPGFKRPESVPEPFIRASEIEPTDPTEDNLTLLSEIAELLITHHQDTAVAFYLNKTIGAQAGKKDRVRWCNTDKKWYIWDTCRWEPDDRGIIHGIAWNNIIHLLTGMANLKQTEAQKKIIKSESDNGVLSAVNLFRTQVSIITNELDADNDVLNVLNGTIDLKTQTIRPHNKADLISKLAPVMYDSKATCPMWEKHLKVIFMDDQGLIDALQRVAGYTMLGGNRENKLILPYGNGRNGKSVTVNTIARVLGEYATNSDSTTYYIKYHNDPGAARGDIARMKGARLITAGEGTSGKSFDESMIKKLTGGDPVTARYPYGRDFDFFMSGTIWIHTNHLPKIRDRDTGIWRRPYPIPFLATIPEKDVIKDYDKILFESEAPGILNWMLKGLKDYLFEGTLLYPEKIVKALEKYKQDTDTLSDFLSRYKPTGKDEDRIKRVDLWNAYNVYVVSEKITKQLHKGQFNDMIAERVGPSRIYAGEHYWFGIRGLTASEQKELEGIG